MMKAKLTDGSVVIGLSRANCEKLLQGKGIDLQLSEMGLPAQRVIIMGGETEQEIIDELTKHAPMQPGMKVHLMSGDGFDRPPKGSH